jgi:hypothetical protein
MWRLTISSILSVITAVGARNISLGLGLPQEKTTVAVLAITGALAVFAAAAHTISVAAALAVATIATAAFAAAATAIASFAVFASISGATLAAIIITAAAIATIIIVGVFAIAAVVSEYELKGRQVVINFVVEFLTVAGLMIPSSARWSANIAFAGCAALLAIGYLSRRRAFKIA